MPLEHHIQGLLAFLELECVRLQLQELPDDHLLRVSCLAAVADITRLALAFMLRACEQICILDFEGQLGGDYRLESAILDNACQWHLRLEPPQLRLLH